MSLCLLLLSLLELRISLISTKSINKIATYQYSHVASITVSCSERVGYFFLATTFTPHLAAAARYLRTASPVATRILLALQAFINVTILALYSQFIQTTEVYYLHDNGASEMCVRKNSRYRKCGPAKLLIHYNSVIDTVFKLFAL
jgi:hypothetical protein